MKAKELIEGRIKREIEAWQDREERRTGRRPDISEYKFPKTYYLLINGRLWTKKSKSDQKPVPVSFNSFSSAEQARNKIEKKGYISQIVSDENARKHFPKFFESQEVIVETLSTKKIRQWIKKLKARYVDFQLKIADVPIDYFRPVFDMIASELEVDLQKNLILNPDDRILMRAAPMIKEIANRIRNARSHYELETILDATDDFLEALNKRVDYERTQRLNKLEKLSSSGDNNSRIQ